MTHRSGLVLIATIFVFTLAVPAHCYIDSGSGSVLIQVVVAGFVGSVFAIKTFLNGLKHKVARVRGNDNHSTRS